MGRFSSQVQGFAAKYEPGGKKEQGRVHSRVGKCQDTVEPGDRIMIVDDQVAHIEPFEVRNQKIDCIDDGARRLRHLQRHLIEMSAKQKDTGYEDETYRGV